MPRLDFSDPSQFSARSYDWRLHCASEAIEHYLKEEVIRTGSKRAFVICSPSIKTKTDTVSRVQSTLGDLYAGYFDGIHVEAPYADVIEATAAAREAGADLLIALGAGSVIVATRVIDIFLCEARDPFEMMTQYPDGKPAVSPRLEAPKLPIINITTTPTSAMNRAGSGIANNDLDHNRMEYFDPKTRPVALIWDHEAILATPYRLIQGFATNGYINAALGAGRRAENPLSEADRTHIRMLSKRGYQLLRKEPGSILARIDLFTSAILANRASDDSLRGVHIHDHETFDGDYALSNALHVKYPYVWQQDAHAALKATVIRKSRTPSLEALRAIAGELGTSVNDGAPYETQMAIADAVERIYQQDEMPTRLRDLNFPKADFLDIAKDTVRVFNANPGVRYTDDQIAKAMGLLEAAW